MNEFMKKKGIWIVVLIVIIILLIAYSRMQRKSDTELSPVADDTTQVDTRVQGDSGLTLDVRNATYTIDGTSIAVVDGVATTQISGSSAVRKTTVLEGPAFADINADGIRDGVVLLRDETGGSGTFYYVAGVLGDGAGQKTTNSILLGDRIRIKEISVDGNTISVTILNRLSSDPMSEAPTVVKVMKYMVSGTTLSLIQ